MRRRMKRRKIRFDGPSSHAPISNHVAYRVERYVQLRVLVFSKMKENSHCMIKYSKLVGQIYACKNKFTRITAFNTVPLNFRD